MSDNLSETENFELLEGARRSGVRYTTADDLMCEFGEEVSRSVIAAEFDHFLYEEPLSSPQVVELRLDEIQLNDPLLEVSRAVEDRFDQTRIGHFRIDPHRNSSDEHATDPSDDFHAIPSEVEVNEFEVGQSNPFQRNRERPEELYSTHELNLGSLRNEVIFPPQDDLAELDRDKPSEFELKERNELFEPFEVDVTPPFKDVIGDPAFVAEARDPLFDLDFLDRESQNEERPYSPFVDYSTTVNLDGDNYDRCIVLPFKVEVTDEDIAHGMVRSTLSDEEKDAVFPIPHHQHTPNVVDTRYFVFNEEPERSYTPYLYALAAVVVIVILILLYQAL